MPTSSRRTHCFAYFVCASIRILLLLALVPGFSAPAVFAAWNNETGETETYFRCTVPYILSRGLNHLRNRDFENAFPWNEVAEYPKSSFLMLHLRTGRMFESHLSGEVMDQATRGRAWQFSLTAMTVDRFTAGFLLNPSPNGGLEMDEDESAMLKASQEYEVFGLLSGHVKEFRNLSPSGPWRELLKGFLVIASLEKGYAVIISTWLNYTSICVPETSPFSAYEIRKAAFTFFSDSNKLDLLTCANFLGQTDPRKLF